MAVETNDLRCDHSAVQYAQNANITTSSPGIGNAVDNEAVLLEVDAHPKQVRAEGPGERPLLGDLLGLVDHLAVEESLLLTTH